MINDTSSERHHLRHKHMVSDEKIQNTANGETDSLDPYEMESRMRAQIERNNEWIEKMSPIVKYKIQEYIRKQRAKKMQRRKFSLACGLNHRIKQEPMPPPSSTSSSRRRQKKHGESTSKHRHMSSTPVLERNLSQPDMSDPRKSASVSNRRKSAPANKMDMRDLDDLE
ncbi:hypothetical protein GCK72_014325 [Caenorhabditis remanei]|uniref:Uncharacterized protein n=1 Tax=Caenorhabditis remanei TaxID=31234 RepID=A0A6A5GQZ5_CAERE|nr:hypothetical protein GCK72_014325 [Caenorhabditis remanei]KAF1757868.1 hypothetical protein GCK72_014325 [Caenorhabditis remanei]